MAAEAELAVIGGSGLYALLDGVEHVVDTPYGEPSGPITVAEVGGRRVAFLPRHGRDHRYPPHLIPYRANLWALRSAGRTPGARALRGRRPAAGAGSGHVRGARPVDRPHQRARADVLRPGRGARVVRRPVLPGRAAHAAGHGGRAGRAGGGRRDGGRGRGPALLDPGGVALVRLDGRHDRQHDRPPGGGAGPRAGPLLHVDRAGHGPGRGCRGRASRSPTRRCSGSSPRTPTGCVALLLDAVAALPIERECQCGSALDGIKLPFPLP